MKNIQKNKILNFIFKNLHETFSTFDQHEMRNYDFAEKFPPKIK